MWHFLQIPTQPVAGALLTGMHVTASTQTWTFPLFHVPLTTCSRKSLPAMLVELAGWAVGQAALVLDRTVLSTGPGSPLPTSQDQVDSRVAEQRQLRCFIPEPLLALREPCGYMRTRRWPPAGAMALPPSLTSLNVSHPALLTAVPTC